MRFTLRFTAQNLFWMEFSVGSLVTVPAPAQHIDKYIKTNKTKQNTPQNQRAGSGQDLVVPSESQVTLKHLSCSTALGTIHWG